MGALFHRLCTSCLSGAIKTTVLHAVHYRTSPLPTTCPQVTSGMYQLLAEEVVAELSEVGRVDLACCPGEQEVLYTLPRWRDLPITPPEAKLQLPTGFPGRASSGESTSAAAGGGPVADGGEAGSDCAAAASPAAGDSEAAAPATAQQAAEQADAASPTAAQGGQSNASSAGSGPSGQSGSDASLTSGPGAAKPIAAKDTRAACNTKPPRPPSAGKAGKSGTAGAAAAAAPEKKLRSRSLSARLATQHWARGLMQPLDSTLPFNTQE